MPTTAESIQNEWWRFFVGTTKMLPTGITVKKLEKLKPNITDDREFWFQVLHRFGANETTPEKYRTLFGAGEESNFALNQMRGNFWAIIQERLQKPRKV